MGFPFRLEHFWCMLARGKKFRDFPLEKLLKKTSCSILFLFVVGLEWIFSLFSDFYMVDCLSVCARSFSISVKRVDLGCSLVIRWSFMQYLATTKMISSNLLQLFDLQTMNLSSRYKRFRIQFQRETREIYKT